MAEERLRVRGVTQIGPPLRAAHLTQRVGEVAIEVDHHAHAMHEHAVLGPLDHSPATAHEQRLARSQSLKDPGLLVAKALLATRGKDVAHAHAQSTLNHLVRVHVGPAEELAQVACEGRFACAEKPHEEDVVAALVDDVTLAQNSLFLAPVRT